MTSTTISGSASDAAAIPVSETNPEPHPLAEAGHQTTETASHLIQRAADIGLEQADRGRRAAAQGIGHLADSVRRLSADLEAEQPAIAGVAATAAQQAERTAQFLEESDARQIITKIEDAARRQPFIFLGGALLLGAIAGRFLKAAGNGNAPRSDKPVSARVDSYEPSPLTPGRYSEGL